MNIKKIYCLLALLFACGICTVNAQQSTTDKFVLSELELAPGGEAKAITISLDGSRIYSGYNLDIRLPEGLSVAMKNGAPNVSLVKTGGILYSEFDEDEETNTYFHQLSCTYGVVGERILRVAVVSTSNKELIATKGKLFRVYLQASSYAKPGIAKIGLTGLNLTTAQAVKYVPENTISESVTISNSAKTTLSVSSAAKWSTCILPFSADIPTGVKAYTCTSNDDEFIYLTEAESFEAYTPYIINAESGYSGTISGTVDPAGYPETGVVKGSYLNGAISPQTATNGFILQNQSEGVKFYAIKEGDSFLIPAGKCWMTLPGSGANGAKALGFKIDGANGIKNVVNIPASSLIFDISGRQQQNVGNGIIIKNGKKILNR